MAEFWKKRDPDPDTEENEFKTQYFQRIDEANHLFTDGGEPGWLQDRGRIYILLGPPADREVYPRGVTFYGIPTEDLVLRVLPHRSSSTRIGPGTTGSIRTARSSSRRS